MLPQKKKKSLDWIYWACDFCDPRIHTPSICLWISISSHPAEPPMPHHLSRAATRIHPLRSLPPALRLRICDAISDFQCWLPSPLPLRLLLRVFSVSSAPLQPPFLCFPHSKFYLMMEITVPHYSLASRSTLPTSKSKLPV